MAPTGVQIYLESKLNGHSSTAAYRGSASILERKKIWRKKLELVALTMQGVSWDLRSEIRIADRRSLTVIGSK